MKISIITLAMSFFLNAAASAQEVAIAKAAELGCHRVERLFDVGKIDESYVKNFAAIRIELDSSGGGKFKWTGFQNAGADGSVNTIELKQDSKGKTMGDAKVTVGSPAVSPNWPDNDPLTLMEKGLHEVLEDGLVDANVAPFLNAMTEGVLDQTTYMSKTVARVVFKNSENAKTFEVLLNLDGTVVLKSVK